MNDGIHRKTFSKAWFTIDDHVKVHWEHGIGDICRKVKMVKFSFSRRVFFRSMTWYIERAIYVFREYSSAYTSLLFSEARASLEERLIMKTMLIENISRWNNIHVLVLGGEGHLRAFLNRAITIYMCHIKALKTNTPMDRIFRQTRPWHLPKTSYCKPLRSQKRGNHLSTDSDNFGAPLVWVKSNANDHEAHLRTCVIDQRLVLNVGEQHDPHHVRCQ